MSHSDASSHGAAGSHGAAKDHVPHVSPIKVYLGTWGALMALTVVTVAVSYVDIGRTGNLIVALSIAMVKATLVATFFMHLLHDSRFHTMILLGGVVFMMIMIAFTMFDTSFRGEADPVEADKTDNIKDPFNRLGDAEPAANGSAGAMPAPDAPPAAP